MNCRRLLLLLIASTVISACSVSGNITDMTIRTTSVSVGQLTGFVAGGSIQTTSGGYQVESMVGDPIANIQSVTSGGYTVYSNVSGNLASSQNITISQ